LIHFVVLTILITHQNGDALMLGVQVLALQPPAATELRPPNRELGVANTREVLRKLRKEEFLGET